MALEEILLKRCQDEELVVDAGRRAAATRTTRPLKKLRRKRLKKKKIG